MAEGRIASGTAIESNAGSSCRDTKSSKKNQGKKSLKIPGSPAQAWESGFESSSFLFRDAGDWESVNVKLQDLNLLFS